MSKKAPAVWMGGKDLLYLDDGKNKKNNFSGSTPPPTAKRRVKNRAAGVGDDYIDIAPTKMPYEHEYTYKTFTPMFIFVIIVMIIFYFTLV